MSNPYFSFKQFHISQAQSAMKVCTDACIFGALLPHDIIGNALDIGAGTGLLSLMYAQKNNLSHIEAVEIDKNSYIEAKNNIAHSPWATRIHLFHTDIQNFQRPKAHYDCIFSNPPFYENDLKTSCKSKNIAWHSTQLNLEKLMSIASFLLKPSGIFAILLPQKRAKEALMLAQKQGLYPSKIIEVQHSPKHVPFRTIFFFKKIAATSSTQTFIIKDAEQNNYTPEFITLLRPYYLHL